MGANPYLITGPALIGFSGGRTSGYLLAQILAAHGGSLPEDVRVVFTNTGREHAGTLRFVHEIESRWGVRVHWIEWRATPSQAANRVGFSDWLAKNDPGARMIDPAGFAEVGFNSASRVGEPFAALVAMKHTTPNGRRPFCTTDLKIEPARALARSWGWADGGYVEPVGLRADEEPGRLAKATADAVKFGRKTLYPLAEAGVTKAMVRAFWRQQPFDLDLPPGHGNCDLCFKKGRKIRERVIRQEPWRAAWWIKREAEAGYTFDSRTSVAALATRVRLSPELPDMPDSDADEFDVECGQACVQEAA